MSSWNKPASSAGVLADRPFMAAVKPGEVTAHDHLTVGPQLAQSWIVRSGGIPWRSVC